MPSNLWPILFHICWVAATTLLPLLAHNLSVNNGTAPLWQQLLGIHVAGGVGIASAFGALVAHHKVAGQKAAALPATAKPGNRLLLCDHMWTEIGIDATDDEIKAIKTLKAKA